MTKFQYSMGSIKFLVLDKKNFFHFPTGSYVKTLSFGGGCHLGILINKKKKIIKKTTNSLEGHSYKEHSTKKPILPHM
jgi:hypothetical protein